MDNTFQVLDFLSILEILKSYVSTPYGEEEIFKLRPVYEIENIKERQEILDEVFRVVEAYGKFPISGTPDIREILKKLSIEDSILDPKEFLLISDFLDVIYGLQLFLKRLSNKGRYLRSVLENIDPLLDLSKRIRKTINKEGFVEDGASFELSEIRRELQLKRMRIKKHLEALMETEKVRTLLQDSYITIRNGRYVLPMKPNFNQALEGIVHDYSHTLKTSFVEPIECVPLNNEINILVRREKEEEERILRELASQVSRYSDVLTKNLEVIKKLDLFCALSLFAKEFDCVKPNIQLSGDLYVKSAVNPLLRKYKGDGVVPIDIILEEKKGALVISGPNAGGKTLALKTMGLILLMAYTGMYVPAQENPQIPLYKRIYAVIGDEQDLSRDLSSFTSHMCAIKEILNETEGGELVLIDEIGLATDPQEASSLAMAIIDAFVEKGCKIVVTTHLGQLKAYGFLKEFASCAACAYDSERMLPLYKLEYGKIGMSNAIQVAKKVGIPEKIIEKSLEYLGKQEYMLNTLCESLNREKEEVIRIRSALRKRFDLVKQKKEEILRRFEERLEKRLKELEEKIKEVEVELKKRERSAIKKAKEVLESQKKKDELSDFGQVELKIGDMVKVKSLGTIGYISDYPDSSGEYEVVIGNIRTRIGKENLLLLEERKKKKDFIGVSVNAEKIKDWKLNIRGMGAEEAIEQVDRFLDKAILEGIKSVVILHGIGTGKLLSKVREYLSQSKYVVNFRIDEKNPGVTVVELR